MTEATNILVVDDSSDGQRLDNFLFRHFRHQAKSVIYKLVRSGQVRINSHRSKPSTRLAIGDKVRLPPKFIAGEQQIPELSDEKKQAVLDNIFYQDDGLIAYDKPSGQPVHAGTGHNYGLIEAMRSAMLEVSLLELVHRIDRLTSGCVLIAKNAAMRNRLHSDWRDHRVGKIYYAVVHGNWPSRNTFIDQPLIYQTGVGLTRVLVNKEGKEARTSIRVMGYFSLQKTAVTLLRLSPETGRMHQLRVHCQSAGHPILGDRLYQNKKQEDLARKICPSPRMYLHAHRLQLPDDYAHSVFVAPGAQWRKDVSAVTGEDWKPEGDVS